VTPFSAPPAPRLNVFIDESGNADLDSAKAGASRFFVVVAVIVDDQQLALAAKKMADVANDLCGGSEISSKRIGGKSRRRLAFLEAVQEVPFRYVAMVVNKDAIDPLSGLRFKRSFHKFFQRILETRLAQYGGGLRVYVDEHGSQEFMDGFGDYLARHIGGTLFYDYEQQFVRSEDSRLVQLADLVAGSLAYCFDESKREETTPRFRELLRSKQIDIAAWPPVEQSADSGSADGAAEDLNRQMAIMAKNRVVRFLHQHAEAADELARSRAATLEILLFARLYEEGDDQSVYGAELVRRLEARGLASISEQAFRSQVVGSLRDSGIVIAGTWRGYRLALSSEDIGDYLAHSKSIVLPMIARMGVARRSVLLDTAGAYDILGSEECSVLRALIDCFADAELEVALVQEHATYTDEADEGTS
jgi:hypothetical protein